MTANKDLRESMYWSTNKEWYRINTVNDSVELTDKATERAVKSFELYCKRNNIP